jgi:hypothetical protein
MGALAGSVDPSQSVFLSTVILVGCVVKAVRGQGVPLNGQRAAAEQAWAEAARCDPTATEYRRQFLRRVERVGARPEQPRRMER